MTLFLMSEVVLLCYLISNEFLTILLSTLICYMYVLRIYISIRRKLEIMRDAYMIYDNMIYV